MTDIPKFKLYGEGDPEIEEAIQPVLKFRSWSDLNEEEKLIALRDLENKGWLGNDEEMLKTILYLNTEFLRQCPGERLHRIKPRRHSEIDHQRKVAALLDFKDIFLSENSEGMVLRMLSVLAQNNISHVYLRQAENAQSYKSRKDHIEEAFKKFDRFANCLNHIFEQFSVNAQITRSGIFPRQDSKISENIYEPTMKILADPKWKSVSDDLGQMFSDYRNKDYPEVITKAHRAVQRFLQIRVGEEGKSGKGEIGKLFATAKKEGILPVDRFTEPLIGVIQSFIVSERATKSTAKPSIKDATQKDAMLMMNVVMVLLQHCLSYET